MQVTDPNSVVVGSCSLILKLQAIGGQSCITELRTEYISNGSSTALPTPDGSRCSRSNVLEYLHVDAESTNLRPTWM